MDMAALHLFPQLCAVGEFAVQDCGERIKVDRPFQSQLSAPSPSHCVGMSSRK
jgi:hypothetical protein